MENVGNENREKMGVKGVWLRWGNGRRKWWAQVFFQTHHLGWFWSLPNLGEKMGYKGGLDGKLPIYPRLLSHVSFPFFYFFLFLSYNIYYFFFYIDSNFFKYYYYFFLSNRSLLVNFYKLYFLSSFFFFFQSNERIFYFSIPLTKHT